MLRERKEDKEKDEKRENIRNAMIPSEEASTPNDIALGSRVTQERNSWFNRARN